MNEALHGIAELPTYTRLADKLLSTQERQDLADLVDVLVEIWRGKTS